MQNTQKLQDQTSEIRGPIININPQASKFQTVGLGPSLSLDHWSTLSFLPIYDGPGCHTTVIVALRPWFSLNRHQIRD